MRQERRDSIIEAANMCALFYVQLTTQGVSEGAAAAITGQYLREIFTVSRESAAAEDLVYLPMHEEIEAA